MPLIQVSLIAGRSAEQRRALAEQLTAATSSALTIDPATVRVILTEVPSDHWFVGGVPVIRPVEPDRSI